MHPRLTILLATFLSFRKTSTVSNQVKSFILQIYRRTRHFVVRYDGTVSILKRGKFQRPSSPFLPEKGRIHGSNPRTPPPYRIVVTRFRVSYRGQKCDGSNLGQCLRRDTPPSTGRNLTNGLQSVQGSRRNRARVCVRVRTRARDTGPGSRPTYDIELHRGQGAKKLFPLSFHSPLPPRERPISPSKEEKIARARVSFCSSTNRRD